MPPTEDVKRSGAVWSWLLGITVLDPDGWNRKNFKESWDEKITYTEFMERAMRSTASYATAEQQALRIEVLFTQITNLTQALKYQRGQT
jgi:hypothetical protein